MKITNYTKLFLIGLLWVSSLTLEASPVVSVLTHGPGEELYSAFGHSAIRIRDSMTSTDDVYNYGVFNYGPGFLKKFVKGETDYYLERQDFERYLLPYQREGRYTHEQFINLDSAETSRLIAALTENAKEENKYYRYDFLRDNCSSRILDVLMDAAPSIEVYKDLNPDEKSFKVLIDEEYRKQHKLWVTLGVRILFGNSVNDVPTSRELSFLPEKLEELLMKSSVRGQPLVVSRLNLSPDNVEFEVMPFYRRPSFVIPLISFILLILFMRTRKSRIVFDIVYIILGLLGVLILGLWIFTVNPIYKGNWNLLWASPLLLALPFLKDRKHHWYKTFLSYSFFFVLVLQLFLKEPFPHEVIPLVFVIWLSLIRFKRFIKSNRKLFSWKR